MVNKLIETLESWINDYYKENIEKLLENFTNDVFKESDFTDVDKIINFINEPLETWKNNIIYKLSAAFNNVKYKWIPLQRYIFIESYKLMAKDSESYNISRSTQLFMNDIYFHLMKYKWENEKIRTLKYYLLMLNIIWMIDFKWSNVYFLIQKNHHEEYYNQLLFYLLERFEEKIDSAKYLWYSVRIVYSSYIYGDIIEYKFKNYNTLINNIAVYKLLHKLYINNKWVEDSKLRGLLKEGLETNKHISKAYSTEESLDKLMEILKNPYHSEVDILQITNYWDDSEGAPSWWLSEEKIEWMIESKPEQVSWSVDDVVKLFWWDINNPYFFILYDIFYNKINTVILYQLTEFEKLYKQTNDVLKYMFWSISEDQNYKNKILLNNLNFIENSNVVEHKKSKYSEEYKMIRSNF